MDRGAWKTVVHRVTKESDTTQRLNTHAHTHTHTHTHPQAHQQILKWLRSTVLMFGSSSLCLPVCHSTSFEYLVDTYESHHATLFPQLTRLRVVNEKSNRGQQTREMSEVGGFRILKVHRFSVVNWHWVSKLGRTKGMLRIVITRVDVCLEEELLGQLLGHMNNYARGHRLWR